jgi:hypothetical protein
MAEAIEFVPRNEDNQLSHRGRALEIRLILRNADNPF